MLVIHSLCGVSMKYKKCTKCNRELFVDEFSFRHKNADGLERHCKECIGSYAKKYREFNKLKMLEYPSRKAKSKYKPAAKIKRNLIKLDVIRYYSNGTMSCKKCGYSDVRALCVDHVNSDGRHRQKDHSSGHMFHRSLIKQNFPEGLQILCANCNLIKQHDLNEWRSENK